jgi:DHA1 family tetracycline resistance protein-like MFS transporter
MAKLPKNSLVSLLPLFLVLIIDTMGLGLIVPVLSPLFMVKTGSILSPDVTMGMRDFGYGLTLTCFAVFLFLGAPFWGDLSDRIGRKKVLIFCLVGTAFGSLICGIAIVMKSFWLLIFGRCFSGYVAGSQGIAQAVIADISTQENKAKNIGIMTFTICIGFVLGPIVGAYFSDSRLFPWFNYSTPFFIDMVLALLNAGYLWLAFKETFYPKIQANIHWIKGFLVFIHAFKRKEIQLLSWVFFLEQCGFVIYFTFVTLFLVQHFAYTQRGVGYFMALFGLVWAIASLLVIPLLLRFLAMDKIVRIFLALTLLGLLGAFFDSELVQWLMVIPIGLGDGICYAVLLAIFSNLTHVDEQGEIMGITNSIAAAAWGIAGLATGVSSSLSMSLPLLLASALIFVGLVLFVVWQKQQRVRPGESPRLNP